MGTIRDPCSFDKVFSILPAITSDSLFARQTLGEFFTADTLKRKVSEPPEAMTQISGCRYSIILAESSKYFASVLETSFSNEYTNGLISFNWARKVSDFLAEIPI